MSEISVFKTDEEKIKIIKIEGGWGYTSQEDCTNIFSPNGQKVLNYFGKLTESEVKMFKVGFEIGFVAGKNQGENDKASEIRKILKI